MGFDSKWLVIAVVGCVLLTACGGGERGDAGQGSTISGDGLVLEPDGASERETAQNYDDGKHCGDGKVKKAEPCDDGNTSDGDGCDAICHVEPGYTCNGEPSTCVTICGDGLVVGAELCDDGNMSDGDGCSSLCAVEPGYLCSGQPSLCAVCGDGNISGAESCDDGNTAGGDGCSAACQVEPGFSCSGSPSLCCIPEAEDNGTIDTATPMPINAVACGSIDPVTDNDYFSFTLSAIGDVTIRFLPGPESCFHLTALTFQLLDGAGGNIIQANNSPSLVCPMIISEPGFTQRLQPGTYYLRVYHWDDQTFPAYRLRVDATVCGNGVVEGTEQCDGSPNCADCLVTTPALGESMQTAEPFPGCPMKPTSQAQLNRPDCFPVGPVHWYSYTSTDDTVAITADFAGKIALYDGAGQLLRCASDATFSPLARFTGTGEVSYIAVPVTTPITCLTMQDFPYTGVGGTVTDLNITFPESATKNASMAVSDTHIFLSTFSLSGTYNPVVFEFPKTGNTTAVVHGAAEGIGKANLGRDIYFANGRLFSVDDTTLTSVNRVFSLFTEAAGTWGPEPWDLTPSYPAKSPSYTITFDGTNLIEVARGNYSISTQSGTPANVYAFSPAAPSAAQLLGSIIALPFLPQAVAADDQYMYMVAAGSSGRGVYRVARSDFSAIPLKIGELSSMSDVPSYGIEVDSDVNPGHLYVRAHNGDTRVIADPGGIPRDLGAISTLGRISSQDPAMAYDKKEHALYIFQAETNPAGTVMKLQ